MGHWAEHWGIGIWGEYGNWALAMDLSSTVILRSIEKAQSNESTSRIDNRKEQRKSLGDEESWKVANNLLRVSFNLMSTQVR